MGGSPTYAPVHELNPSSSTSFPMPTTGWAGTDEEPLAGLFEDIGTDEVHLIPSSLNIDQLRHAAEVARGVRLACEQHRAVQRPGVRCGPSPQALVGSFAGRAVEKQRFVHCRVA